MEILLSTMCFRLTLYKHENGISSQNGAKLSFHLLGRMAPIDVVVDDEEDERADLSFSSLSSLNAFWNTSCRSWNLLFFSVDVSLPKEAISVSSSMIWSSTFEHRGKKRFPSSTGTQNHLVINRVSIVTDSKSHK